MAEEVAQSDTGNVPVMEGGTNVQEAIAQISSQIQEAAIDVNPDEHLEEEITTDGFIPYSSYSIPPQQQQQQQSKFNTMPAFATKPEETNFRVYRPSSSNLNETDSKFDPAPPESPRKIKSPDTGSPKSDSSPRSPRTATLFRTQQENSPPTLKERAMKLEPLFNLTKEEYDNLLAELVADRKSLASSHKFKDSTKVTNAIRHVEACQIQQQKYELQVEAVQEYDEQVADFKSKLAAFDKETEDLETELRGKLAQQRQRILAIHQKELDNHVKKWSSDAMKRQYNHASFQLRTLQKQFRLMMLECRFQEAEEVKAIIDRTEKAEQRDATKQMQHDFEEATNKLKAKLDLEMSSYEQRAVVQIRQQQQKRGWLRISFLNKQRKFEQRAAQIQDQDKLWNIHQLQRKEEVARGEMLTAPNTSNRLNEEDVKDREHPTLQLPPLKVTNTMTKTNR